MQTFPIWKTQPIFISSTFTDMMAERDLLRDFVFPELEERLAERRIRLEPIDLRWGVETNSEQEQERKELMVLKVCLDEIDRSLPFFIGIIGDRYGWIPPAQRMKKAEKEKGFNSTIENKSVTALEIEYGVLSNKEQLERSIFFFREPLPYDKIPNDKKSVYTDMYNPEFSQDEAHTRLENFKNLIISKVGRERVFSYKADWQNGKVTGLEDFKKKVSDGLWKLLDEETKDIQDLYPQTWQAEERKHFEEFVADRTSSFGGRSDLIDDLVNFAKSNSVDDWGLCLTGEAGGGKSSLIAKTYEQLKTDDDVFVLGHAAGISLRAGNLQNMLALWIEELAAELNIDVTSDIENAVGVEGFSRIFTDLLTKKSEEERVVVLVDALNQFENVPAAKYVSWLPELIPANTKFIFTAIAGEETENLEKKHGMRIEQIKEIKKTDAEEIINILCSKYRKTLNPQAVDILLQKQNNGRYSYSNPLWLTMAVDEFLLLDEDDFARMRILEGTAEQKLKQLMIDTANALPSDVPGMYNYIFSRCKIFGSEFVADLLSYIGISRCGLRESDLEALLGKSGKTDWDILNFASFRRFMRSHLVRKGSLGLYDFRHAQVRINLFNSLLSDKTKVINLHRLLSDHLLTLSQDDPLKASEIMWHLFKCDNKKAAAEIYGGQIENILNKVTGEHSAALRDIINENYGNVNWVSSFLELSGVTDENKQIILHNFLFSLGGLLKNYLPQNPRLKFYSSIKDAVVKLYEQSEDVTAYGRNLFVVYSEMGVIYNELSDVKRSLHNYKKAFEISEELYKHEPDDDAAKDLAGSYLNLGDGYSDAGDKKLALECYEKALAISKELCGERPHSLLYGPTLAHSYNRLGDFYDSEGKTKEAIENYETALQIRTKIFNIRPDKFVNQQSVAVSCSRLGRIYKKLNNFEKAKENYYEALKIEEALHRLCPDSLENAFNLAVTYSVIGDILSSEGKTEEALLNYERTVQIREKLLKQNRDDVELRISLAWDYLTTGNVHNKLGNTEKAIICFENSMNIREDIYEKLPGNIDNMERLAGVYMKIGDLCAGDEYKERKKMLYEKALAIRVALVEQYPDSEDYAREVVVSCSKLRRKDELIKALKYMIDKNMYLDPPLVEQSKIFGLL